jgi:Effector-associated domain 11
MNKERIHNLIASDKIEIAVDALIMEYQNREGDFAVVLSTLLLLKGRQSQMQKEMRLGTISYEDYVRERANINYALLEFMNYLEITDEYFVDEHPISSAPSMRVQYNLLNFNEHQNENTFWSTIKRLNTINNYQKYITQYPQGKYVKEANEALTRLQKPIAQPNNGFKGSEIAVTQGTILYDVPNKMQLLQEVKCMVRIAFDEVMAKLDYKMTPDTELKTMRVSNVMNVELFDASQQAFEIRTVNARQQFIDRDYFTQWLFYVKPLKEGNYTLLLKGTLIEKINGQERPWEIVLEEMVNIVANLPAPEASRVRAAGKIIIGLPQILETRNQRIVKSATTVPNWMPVEKQAQYILLASPTKNIRVSQLLSRSKHGIWGKAGYSLQYLFKSDKYEPVAFHTKTYRHANLIGGINHIQLDVNSRPEILEALGIGYEDFKVEKEDVFIFAFESSNENCIASLI